MFTKGWPLILVSVKEIMCGFAEKVYKNSPLLSSFLFKDLIFR